MPAHVRSKLQDQRSHLISRPWYLAPKDSSRSWLICHWGGQWGGGLGGGRGGGRGSGLGGGLEAMVDHEEVDFNEDDEVDVALNGHNEFIICCASAPLPPPIYASLRWKKTSLLAVAPLPLHHIFFYLVQRDKELLFSSGTIAHFIGHYIWWTSDKYIHCKHFQALHQTCPSILHSANIK